MCLIVAGKYINNDRSENAPLIITRMGHAAFRCKPARGSLTLLIASAREWASGQVIGNTKWMENADNFSEGLAADRVRAREKTSEGRNNPGRYFIRCCGAVDAQSFHKRCSWAR